MNSFLSELKQWSFANFTERFAAALPKLIVFIVVIAVGFWLSKLAGKLMVKILESKNVDKSMHRFADGKVIATGNTIDLDDYSEEIGSYVRAEIVGEGGVIYTQPFTLEYDGAPEAETNRFVDLGGATTLLADTIVKFLVKVLKDFRVIDIIWYFLTK